MATTAQGNSPTARTDQQTLYWGIGIAIVLALIVILTVQTTSIRDTVTAPATSETTSNSATAPVQRTDVPPMQVAPENVNPATDSSLSPTSP